MGNLLLKTIHAALALPDPDRAAMKKAAEGALKGILEFCDKPLVSSDFNGNHYSSIFDADSTMVTGGNLVKVFSWYDNETGYSTRLVELAAMVGKKL